jgi:cytochrome c oxidase subunit 3
MNLPRDPNAERDRPAALQVGGLPTFVFGHRSLMWWGTMGLVAVEGTVFALSVMSYLYLRSHAQTWPLTEQPPDLWWGTLNTALLLLSVWPNYWTKQAAERLDLRAVRMGMVVCLLFALAFLAVRVMEFRALNSRWDSSAYGSAVWMLMGLHTTHLLTDAYDTAVLLVVMFTGLVEGKRFTDVSENAAYWYFVVVSWLPIYLIVYWAPRW